MQFRSLTFALLELHPSTRDYGDARVRLWLTAKFCCYYSFETTEVLELNHRSLPRSVTTQKKVVTELGGKSEFNPDPMVDVMAIAVG